MKSRIQNSFTHRQTLNPQPSTLNRLRLPQSSILRATAAEGGATVNPQPVSAPSTLSSQPSTAYVLRKGLGFWQLTFAGERAIFKHEQGAFYVAHLLLHPPAQPIHALDLATRVAGVHAKSQALAEIIDPVTGEVVTLTAHARIQERGLGLDRAETIRAVLREQKKLEAILEDETTSQPVREEVQRELVALYKYEEKNTARTRDSARRAGRAVSGAIKRLRDHLAGALNADGRPHRVLRAFAAHIERHVLIPSRRYAGAGRASARAGIAGCFTYEPPVGVVWGN